MFLIGKSSFRYKFEVIDNIMFNPNISAIKAMQIDVINQKKRKMFNNLIDSIRG